MQKSGYEMGDHLSEEVKSLISSILQFNPEKRATTQKILEHPWIKNMENCINICLKSDNIAAPKEIHEKITTLTKTNNRRSKD